MLLVVLAGSAACPLAPSIQVYQPEAGATDAFVVDGSPPDATGADGGRVDGSPADTGFVLDAGPRDRLDSDRGAPGLDATLDEARADAGQRGFDRVAVDHFLPGPDASPGDLGSGGDSGLPDQGPEPGVDSDGDGLDDAWEWAAGDPGVLDWQRIDSDGDGTADGDEDPDGDGLSNAQEFAAARLPRWAANVKPHPLRRDLLVELDAMSGRMPADAVLDLATEVYADLPLVNVDGSTGVALHFVIDQIGLPVQTFDGSFAQRNAYLRDHGPSLVDDGQSPPLPFDQMIHVVFASQRSDLATRGGELVGAGAGDVEAAGVFVYYDAIDALHPACGRPVDPVLPDIILDEALGATLAHELGHALQLGHDTDSGGGVNTFNLMSVPTGCLQAQQRMHGDGNSDPDLGATRSVFAPRFSREAATLMRFTRKISVDVADFDQAGGYSM